ncbi:MAG: DUF456 domain-containing protein [Chloroflexi bacterium]|nr:DUF456 domain-containing protein [Chloroflexota bacterium]
MVIVWFVLAVLLMLSGLIGSLLPFVPGLPLILAGVYLYALATGLAAGVGLGQLVIYTLVGGVAIIASSLASPLGARAAGGSRAGMIGATLGLLLGLVFAVPVGLVIGPFAGAVAGELLAGRSGSQSIRSGFGTALGILA